MVVCEQVRWFYPYIMVVILVRMKRKSFCLHLSPFVHDVTIQNAGHEITTLAAVFVTIRY